MTDQHSEQSEIRSVGGEISPYSPATNETDLKFPRILLEASFSSLLSHSIPSTSSSPAAGMAEAGLQTNSLSESWASLSNSEYAPSEDIQSETNDGESLVDVDDAEDVHSIDNRDDLSDSGLPSSGIDNSVARLAETLESVCDGSTHTTGPGHLDFRPKHPDSIEFDEPEHWPEVGHVDVKHILKVFPQDDVDSLNARKAASQLVGTIRMTMSRKGLSLHQPFRVFYNGRLDALEYRTDILHTLAAALIAWGDLGSPSRSMESSRYHVFQPGFGPEASPEHAEMVPIHTQMVVDDCIDASSIEDSSGHQQILLTLKNREVIYSRWDGIWQSVQERRQWSRPDVALLLACRDSDSEHQKQVTRLMHECMLRHNVPTLVINEEVGWASWSQNLTLDPHSLHRCIEARTSNSSSGRVQRRLPIDLDTFKNLDPEQLNKHLSCLNDVAASRIAATRKSVSFVPTERRPSRPTESLEDVEKNMSRSYMAQHQKIESFRLLSRLTDKWILVAVAFALVTWALATPLLGQGLMLAPFPSSATVTSTVTEIPFTTSSSGPTTKQSAVPVRSQTTSISVRGQTDLARLLSDPFVDTANQSEKFQVEVVGDCHMVVKFPQVLRKRKEPQVFVRATRGNDTLHADVSKLFEGVYSVQINRDDAYGLLNLTIIVTKPSINETIELDFGSPWLKVASWEKARREMLARVFRDVDLDVLRSAMRSMVDMPWPHRNKSAKILSHCVQDWKTVSMKAQDSLTQLTKKIQLMTQTMRKYSLEQQWHMTEHVAWARDTIQMLADSSEGALDKAKAVAETSVSDVKEGVNSVRRQVSRIRLSDVKKQLHDIAHSEALSKAQSRAHQIIAETAKKLQQHRQDVKRKAKSAKANRKGRDKPSRKHLRT